MEGFFDYQIGVDWLFNTNRKVISVYDIRVTEKLWNLGTYHPNSGENQTAEWFEEK